jgi:hypothetical protein
MLAGIGSLQTVNTFNTLCFKGTVQRDGRWVENGLKRCVLINYLTASLLFLILKRYHHRIYNVQDEAINVVIYSLNANIHVYVYEVLNEIYLYNVKEIPS